MFKRLRWMSIGAALGVMAYVRAKEKAEATRQSLAQRTGGNPSAPYALGKYLGARLREALANGRQAMRQQEVVREEMLDEDGGRTSPTV